MIVPRWIRLGSQVSALVASTTILASIGHAQERSDSLESALRNVQSMERVFQHAIDRAAPSVVSVFLLGPPDERRAPRADFGGLRADVDQNLPESYEFFPSGFGSGIIVDPKGLILTSFHVVRAVLREPRMQLRIHFHDGRRASAAIYAADPRSDLVVLKLTEPVTGLTAIAMADGEKVVRGQFVLAIGNPFGTAAPDGITSASWGIVSNVRRRPAKPADMDREEEVPIYLFRTLIQTDARLNTGISGGALIDIEGRLIGITVALSAANGIETPGGFAIPTDALTRRIVATLIEGKEVEYGFLGISPMPVPRGEGEGGRGRHGILVRQVVPYVPAARSGLVAGDIITEINGHKLQDQNDLMLAVGSLKVGAVVDALVRRGETTMRLKIPLAKYPVKGEVIATNRRPAWNGIRVDWLSTLAGPGTFFERGDRNVDGVVVREVTTGSKADSLGIREKQVISKVNGVTVTSPDEFEKAVATGKSPIRLEMQGNVEHVFEGDSKTPPTKAK